MSADNWATCPRCKANAEAEGNAAKLEAGKAYGKVAPDVYLEMLRKASAPVAIDNSLREDYEVGILENGEFFISYRGYCENCKLKFDYKHSEVVK